MGGFIGTKHAYHAGCGVLSLGCLVLSYEA
jgi:hypothetical protein